MRSTPLNLLDQLYLNLDSAEEPWSVQLEMRVCGRVDPVRLEHAFQQAMRQHPMTRGSLRPVKDFDTGYTWDIPEEMPKVPLEVLDVSADGAVAQARADLQSRLVDVASPPPFAAMLAQHPEGDYVMLNLNHVIGDGLSAFRFMTSVARTYAGEPDPVPDFDPLENRDLTRLAGSGNAAERMRRLTLFIEHLWNSRTPPVRVKKRHEDGDAQAGLPGYGFVMLELTPAETELVMAKREKPATINDVLLAGLILAVKEWNRREGGRKGRVAIMMPVNLRPKAWWYEVVTNFSSYVSISVQRDQQTDFRTVMHAVYAMTTRLKEEGGANALIDLLAVPKGLPAFIKKRLRDIVPLVSGASMDTAVLSNLGLLKVAPSFGDAGSVREIWFSPPGMMPLGVSVGAASMDGRLFLTIRYRKAQFDEQAAAAFADVYRSVLLG